MCAFKYLLKKFKYWSATFFLFTKVSTFKSVSPHFLWHEYGRGENSLLLNAWWFRICIVILGNDRKPEKKLFDFIKRNECWDVEKSFPYCARWQINKRSSDSDWDGLFPTVLFSTRESGMMLLGCPHPTPYNSHRQFKGNDI